jgi:hypothetical protein
MRLLAAQQHAGDVVDAAASEQGCDILAVVNLAQLDSELRIDGRKEVLERLWMPYEQVLATGIHFTT